MSTWHTALYTFLIVGAAAVEASAAQALLEGALELASAAHAGAAALAGVAGAQSCWRLGHSLPHDRFGLRSEGLRLAWVSGSIVLALPVFGLGGIVVLALTTRARRHARHRPLRELDSPWVRMAALGAAPGTSAGGRSIEPATEMSLQARLDRLLVLRRVRGARAVRGMRLALSDRNEEVRLLAYALLQQREAALRVTLDGAQAELQRCGALDRACTAHVSKRGWLLRLAQAHWELASSTLVSGEAARAALDAALQFGQDALAIRFDGATALLLAGVSLARDDVAGAHRWLGYAAREGVSAAARASYEAEVSFRQRRAEPPAELGSQRPRSVPAASRRAG
jgi:hypothetical protein